MKRGLIEQRSILSSDPTFLEYFGIVGADGSGVTVGGPDQAMKLSAVYRSVSILAGTIASLPLYPRKRIKGEHFEVNYDSPLYRILRWKASKRLTAYETMESAVALTLMRGNSYLFPRFKDYEYDELVLLTPGTVAYDKATDSYKVNDINNNINGTFESWRLIHIRNKNLDGSKDGISTIEYASKILDIAANADEQTLYNMKSGNKQKGFLTGGNVLEGMGRIQDSQVDTVAKRLEEELASGKSVMRLPGELKWNPYSISPADAQILENRRFSAFDICRFFGVHPDKVFMDQAQNYKASEMSQSSFMTDTLQPLLTQIEQEFTTKLISYQYIGTKEKIIFDRVALYQLDPKGAATYYKEMFSVGGMTSNEIRLVNDRPPVEGGDRAFVTANVAPIDSPKISGESS